MKTVNEITPQFDQISATIQRVAEVVDENRVVLDGNRAEFQEMINEVVIKVEQHKVELDEAVKSTEGVATKTELESLAESLVGLAA